VDVRHGDRRPARAGQPRTTAEPVQQDVHDDPSTASSKTSLTLAHASQLKVAMTYPTNDVDLYVVYDANRDGRFTTDEIVASSTRATT
jgi:hypothetical protein